MEFDHLVSYKDAVVALKKNLSEVPSEQVDLGSCLGRILGSDIKAPLDSPPFDRAAMDGFAVRSGDLVGVKPDRPASLEIIETVYAGDCPRKNVEPGTCTRIATGGMMPPGADAVIMKEYTRETNTTAEMLSPLAPGTNISRRGEDFTKGRIVLKKGTTVSPQALAVARAAGVATLPVKRRATCAILTTGSELLSAESTYEPGKIIETNSIMLMSLAQNLGCIPVDMGSVSDSTDKLQEKLVESRDYDLFLVTGGTSVGEKDMLPSLVHPPVHGISIRPGKPFGFRDNILLLSGYPVSAFIQWYAFVIPACEALYGCSINLKSTEGTLKTPVISTLGRKDYIRASIDEGRIVPMKKGSSNLTSLLGDGFFIVPENVEGMNQGEKVRLFFWM
ncbi:MAG: molybdopterin molybdotransferase MoeA [Theionarchaea archaeon]|nr:molybdopterin molybdotransferase MoeA [Theionarchaea archaeon]